MIGVLPWTVRAGADDVQLGVVGGPPQGRRAAVRGHPRGKGVRGGGRRRRLVLATGVPRGQHRLPETQGAWLSVFHFCRMQRASVRPGGGFRRWRWRRRTAAAAAASLSSGGGLQFSA